MNYKHPALIEVQQVDCGDYLEVIEIWNLHHPDCPYVTMTDEQYAAVAYLTDDMPILAKSIN